MRDIERQISELMAKMNLDQKIGQIVQAERQFIVPEEVKKYHIGSVLSGGGSTPGENKPQDWIQMNDAYWAASMERDNGNLPIPLIYGVDAIHGHTNVKGAVIFPHNIGLGAARDADLIERIAIATAREIAATGVDWTFAPTLAVARNDHWGRTYESYAEHSEVVAEYAPRFVKGLQGRFGDHNVISCVKHWVGDGATLHGIDQGESCVSEEELRRIHIHPYRAAIKAGVLTVMASLNSWNQIKCHGHHYLLTDVLKNELGFDGVVISDWDGIGYLSDDFEEAAAIGLNAGLDMFMVTEKWKEFIEAVKNQIELGRIPMERLDDAVRRILRVKLKSGMFEKPRPTDRKFARDSSCFGSKEHREIAREAVRKSLVMLKNEDSILPLDKTAQILVAGKNADNRGHQCGGFTIDWQGVTDNESIVGGTSVWEGIKAIAPNAVLSKEAEGKDADPDKHSVAIVVIGEKPYAEMLGDVRVAGLPKGKAICGGSEALELEKDASQIIMEEGPYGTSICLKDLHPEDYATIENICNKGIPVVVVMICGRPLVVNKELEASSAFVVAWLPGSEGQGLADVVFGDYEIQGKLSFSWPQHDQQNPNIGDESYDPLFPFGFGLTYKQKS
jgi:beta-glucosidase